MREVLLFCFNWKKSAADAHRMLVEVYGESAPSDKSCRGWYQRFKNGDFDVGDKERTGRPKKFKDAELKSLIDENPNQTVKQLAETLNCTQSTVFSRIKTTPDIVSKRRKTK